MSIKHIAASSAAIAIVGFGAVAGAVSLTASTAAATTPQTASAHSWSEQLASAPQPAFHR